MLRPEHLDLLRRIGVTASPGPALRLRQARSRLRLDWIVAAMAFLAALAYAGQLTVSDQAQRWRTGLSGTLTVEIPGEPARPAAELAAVLSLLRATQGVARAEPLNRTQVADLLAPWLGTSALVETLPVPQLIDVSLEPGATVDTAFVAKRLAEIAPGVTIDDHGRWLSQLLRLAGLASLTALVIVAVVALSAVVAVTITTRAGLALHHEAIDLLHLVGAEDRYIAREFGREAMFLGLRGGVFGIVIAIAALYALLAATPALESMLVPSLAPRPGSIAALVLVAAAASLICGFTAWITVMAELRKRV